MSLLKEFIEPSEKTEALARKFMEFGRMAGPKATVNDFFEYCRIPPGQRRDFAFGAILNGAARIKEQERFWEKIRRYNEEGGEMK